MIKNIIISLALFLSLNLVTKPISEEEVVFKVNQFFELLDIEAYEKEKISNILTKDFQIFEMGKAWDMDEFDKFIQEASQTTASTSWILSDYVISVDENSAHVSYRNDGVFQTKNDETIISYWLESVYLVKEEGELKLKFLQSDLVNRETK